MKSKLDLKKKWKGFLKRSSAYKMAVLYGIIGLLFFSFAFYVFFTMASTYRDNDSSFMLETPDQLRALGFLISISLFSGSFVVFALLMWTCSLFFFMSDQEHRLKRIEEFIEKDGVVFPDLE